MIILLPIIIFIFVFIIDKYNSFLARKILHSGIGISIILLQYFIYPNIYKYLVTIIGLISLIIPLNLIFVNKLKCIKLYDINVITYIITTIISVNLDFNMMNMSPMYFADPLASIVGKFFTKINYNITIYKNKTISGLLTCFLVSYILTYNILLSIIISLTELIIEINDNFYIWLILFIYYL